MGRLVDARLPSIASLVAATAVTVAATVLVTSAWNATAAPGDADATYVPTPGCRAFDLRPGDDQVGPRSTPLGPRETYTQQITGPVGNCTGALAIPTDAVAVAMNVTAVDPTAQTNVRLFDADLAEVPLLSNLNVWAGQAPFPNKVDVRLSASGAITLFNQNGSVSLVGDIVGYYTDASLTELATDVADARSRLAALEAPVEVTYSGRGLVSRAPAETNGCAHVDPGTKGFLPLQVPTGATITAVSADVREDASYTITLVRETTIPFGQAPNPVAQIDGADNFGSTRTVGFSFVPRLVEPGERFVIRFVDGDLGAGAGLCSVTVTYDPPSTS